MWTTFREFCTKDRQTSKVVAGEGVVKRVFRCFKIKELTKGVYIVRNYIVKGK